MSSIVVRHAEIEGHSPLDLRIADGIITEIGPGLGACEHDEVIDAHGGALLPGLCDHHVHLLAMAATLTSVQCGPPAVAGSAALAAALACANADQDGWVRGVGYSEEVAGLPDAAGLDRLHADRPVRIQHRSGALWIVNTAGAHALGLSWAEHPGIERDTHSRPTGRLWRADDWLRTKLPRANPPDLRPVGARLARLGISHVTDATADLDSTAIAAIATGMQNGDLPQHVQLLGAPLGWTPSARTRSPTLGPHKIILADSGLPDLGTLTQRIVSAYAAGRAVSFHCVTREALVLLLAALEDAGTRPGARIEHAALVPDELIPALHRHCLTVVTQPAFLSSRGDDYRRDVPLAEHADLYRARSLLEVGVGCVVSSDAPYGPLDPWAVIRAATLRTSPSGHVLGPAERLTASQALRGYLSAPDHPGGPRRPLKVGSPADLVVLRLPLAPALAASSGDLIAATIIDGVIKAVAP